MTCRPEVVFFSSTSENTKRFVDKLDVPSLRLPLTRAEPVPLVDHPYVLITPTYGAGLIRGSVPKRTVDFLNVEQNRRHCVGVVCGGNLNFGDGAFSAGWLIAEKLGVPVIHNFEVLGSREDVEVVKQALEAIRNNSGLVTA